MTLTKFEINCDRTVYYVGQNIAGLLIVELDKPIRLRDRILQAGEYKFPFCYNLPLNLRGSYRHEYELSVEYSVTAVINRNNKLKHDKKKIVTVMTVFDLNEVPRWMKPIFVEKWKQFFLRTSPFVMSCFIPCAGFVSGQIIPLKFMMINECGIKVKKIVIHFHQIVYHFVNNRGKFNRTIISKTEIPLSDGSGRKEILVNIRVPALPPSNVERFINDFKLEYFITLTAIVGIFRQKYSISSQIHIGNIPYLTYQKPIIREELQFCPEMQFTDFKNNFPQLEEHGKYVPPE